MTSTITTSTQDDNTGHFAQLVQVLTDDRFDGATNRARLQGWRDADLLGATEAGPLAQRIGPLSCAALAFVAAATGSMPVILLALATGLIGIVARNHAAEVVYNAVVRRTGGQPLPPNRAAKRTGCLVGSLFLAGSAVTQAIGATAVSQGLLITLGSLATFVAITSLCVPSMLFTLLFGAERGTRHQLITLRA